MLKTNLQGKIKFEMAEQNAQRKAESQNVF